MRNSTGLKQRIAFTLFVFSLLSACVVGGLGYILNEELELSIWRHTLQAELDFYLARQVVDPDFKSSDVAQLRVYEAGLEEKAPPDEMANLPPGIHDELLINDRSFCVLVTDIENKRYYVAYDISELEAREYDLAIVGFFALIVIAFAVLLLSIQLSRWLHAPITELANAVSALSPNDLNVALAQRFKDYEAKVIAQAVDDLLGRISRFILREQEFVNMASHEFRTPIAAISGAVEVVEHLSDSNSATRKPLERIRRNAKDLDETITALLFISREKESKLHSTDTHDVAKLLPSIVENHTYLIGSKDIKLVCDVIEPTPVAAPERMITIVIGNLVRNAIQHTESGKVVLRLSNNILQVADTGRGMSEAEIMAATQLDSPRYDRASEHGGLGLYIINQISAQFGWRLTVESSVGRGSTFSLNFAAGAAVF